jgi:hypothetical protein
MDTEGSKVTSMQTLGEGNQADGNRHLSFSQFSIFSANNDDCVIWFSWRLPALYVTEYNALLSFVYYGVQKNKPIYVIELRFI